MGILSILWSKQKPCSSRVGNRVLDFTFGAGLAARRVGLVEPRKSPAPRGWETGF